MRSYRVRISIGDSSDDDGHDEENEAEAEAESESDEAQVDSEAEGDDDVEAPVVILKKSPSSQKESSLPLLMDISSRLFPTLNSSITSFHIPVWLCIEGNTILLPVRYSSLYDVTCCYVRTKHVQGRGV